MNIFRSVVFFLTVGVCAAVPGLGAAEKTPPGGEIIILHGCEGGKIRDENAADPQACFCPANETDVLGICTSDDLLDFFDHPWGVVCVYWGCGSGNPRPRPPSIDICILDDGTTCADEFNFCRNLFVSDGMECRAQARRTAVAACNQNLWPNNSLYQTWHRVGSYYCPSQYDDPTSAFYWFTHRSLYRCTSASDVYDDCLNAWLTDASSGGGGNVSFAGFGIGGSSGGNEAGALAAARCNLRLNDELDACIEDVVEEKNCPADCDTAPTERIIFDPLRPDQKIGKMDAAQRAVLVAVNRMEQERYINRLGYEYLDRRSFERAIEAFRVNVENFPRSANAHDSLAEALERSGRPRLAAASYRRALDFDPDKKSAKTGLARLQRKGAAPVIRQ